MAKAGLESIGLPVAEREQELVGEGLTGGTAYGQAGAVGEEQARDRAQQVGLADTGRAADEQRVVGLSRHLRDRQRGGVGQVVAVANHELVERELGVAQWSVCVWGAQVELGGALTARSAGTVRAAARSSRCALVCAVEALPLWISVAARTADDLDHHVRAHRDSCAGL